MESSTVCPNPRRNCMAVDAGMTKSTPMSSAPTMRMERVIVTAVRLTSKRFSHETRIPLALATSSSKAMKKSSL